MDQLTDVSQWHSPPSADDLPGLLDRSRDHERDNTVSLNEAQEAVRSSKIMIVDDEALIVRVVRRFLSADGYENFVTVTDPREVLEAIDREKPDVVLLDINMPHITGLDLLKIRQNTTEFQHIPFIILSANSENEIKREALQLGATDFLSKPVDPSDLTLRVQNALTVKRHHDHLTNHAVELEKQVRERTQQIEESREQIINCLARAGEFRDNVTGDHVTRVGKYCGVIANQLGYNDDYCREIELAAQLHDVGKIGIPDSVLLNPGKLTKEEFTIMKTHCELGLRIMEPLADTPTPGQHRRSENNANLHPGVDTPMLELAAIIALTHHEKWDGTGYPRQIKAEDIPIEGRICTVADVYDALCSERPYKPSFPVKKCLEIMLSERGTRFDPDVLDAFFLRIEDIEGIRSAHHDSA